MKYRVLETEKDCFVPQWKDFFFWKAWKVFQRWDICGEVYVDKEFKTLDEAKEWIKQQHALGQYPKLSYEEERV